jgi:hypothetical protein
VAQVQVWRGGIEASLDPQWAAKPQKGFQLLAFEDLVGTSSD